MSRRRGVAMITVLGVVTLASVVAFASADAGRLALGATRNRVEESRAYWLANGCAARAVAALDERWQRLEGPARDQLWRDLDTEESVTALQGASSCSVRLESVGSSLDLLRTDGARLARLVALLLPTRDAAEVSEAIIQWRDSSRLAEHRGPLGRRALAASLAARGVSTTEEARRVSEHLAARSGPVDALRAPAAVLAALPGFNPRTADAFLRLRAGGTPVRNLNALIDRLSREDAADLGGAFTALATEVVFEPSEWRLTAEVTSDRSIGAVVHWRVGRASRSIVAAPEVP